MPDLDLGPDHYRVKENGRWRIRDDWRVNLFGSIVLFGWIVYGYVNRDQISAPILYWVGCGAAFAAGLLMHVVFNRLDR